jgi:hypothetical protein
MYADIVATGFLYSWPRTPATRCPCETPMPIATRPGASSPSVSRIARMLIASRA